MHAYDVSKANFALPCFKTIDSIAMLLAMHHQVTMHLRSLECTQEASSWLHLKLTHYCQILHKVKTVLQSAFIFKRFLCLTIQSSEGKGEVINHCTCDQPLSIDIVTLH